MRHPRYMCAQDVEAILTMLATELRVLASTQNQAISTLLFLYREVLGINLPWRDGVSRPAQKSRISNVLTKEDVAALLQFLDLDMQLLAQLLYVMGTRLRIQDVDFGRHVIIVREAKGNKDRVVMLRRALAPALRQQLLHARRLGARPSGAARRPVRWTQRISAHGRPLCGGQPHFPFDWQPPRQYSRPHRAIAVLAIMRMNALKCARFTPRPQLQAIHPEPALP